MKRIIFLALTSATIMAQAAEIKLVNAESSANQLISCITKVSQSKKLIDDNYRKNRDALIEGNGKYKFYTKNYKESLQLCVLSHTVKEELKEKLQKFSKKGFEELGETFRKLQDAEKKVSKMLKNIEAKGTKGTRKHLQEYKVLLRK